MKEKCSRCGGKMIDGKCFSCGREPREEFPGRICKGYDGHKCDKVLPENSHAHRCDDCLVGHRRSYQKKLAKISRQKLETIRKKNSDKEDTCIAIPPPDTPGDRIKRLVDEIVGYETEIDKKKEEIVELLH